MEDVLLKEQPQPAGTFQYLPDNYSIPNFEMSDNQKANDVVNGVKANIEQQLIKPRKEIDTKLRAFRERTGKSPNAALPTCFESWKEEAFKNSKHISPENPHAFKVKVNCNQQVEKIYPNEEDEYLTREANDISDEMNELLSACLEFLDKREEIEAQLEEEKEKLNQPVMKVRNMKTEIDGLVTELRKQVGQVEALLADIKAAVSNQAIMIRSKPATGLIAIVNP